MSLKRLVFYSAMIGGWAAFVGWLLSECILLRRSTDAGPLVILFTTALVGACIAGGLTLLGGVASGTLQGQWHRLLPGLAGGFVAGALGGLIGNQIYSAFAGALGQAPSWSLLEPVIRILGWTVMGLGIGAVEGIYDRSAKKIRNGLIGGGLGGFLGGLCFAPVYLTIGGVMSSRAAAFVILGLCIGCLVGLAQVILKEAWLTVEDGFRPGRQLVLNVPEIIMGTSEKAALPFIAFGAKGVEPIHVRIIRRDDGAYLLQDNKSRSGTFVNGQQVHGAVILKNEDAIKLGVNVVRFREVHRHVAAGQPTVPEAPPRPVSTPVPAADTGVVAMGKLVGSTPASPSRPKPAPSPPARPAPPAPAVPVPPDAGTATARCPICGRVGGTITKSNKRRCVSCGIHY